VSGQLLTPTDTDRTRVIVGTWRSSEEWETWYHDPEFLEQRTKLQELEAEPSATEWYLVVADAHE
jgi:heme-degrading monooxygenase HmoA